jgi:transcriptional regulator with XRE-family HTH domain
MQKRHIMMKQSSKKRQMQLPRDFGELRDDLGLILRKCRLKNDYSGCRTQAAVASRVGISRESLSRIERGQRQPSFDTLSKLMGLFKLDGPEITKKVQGSRPFLHYAVERRQDLGWALRAGRLEEGFTLQALAEQTGMSVSQLSRIERSQSTRSRVIEIQASDRDRPIDDKTVFKFTNRVLARLAEKGEHSI